MKRPIIFLLLILGAGISFAQKKPSVANEVEVGMTYDQVRKEMGKPVSEEKGYTKVQNYSVVILAVDSMVSWTYPLFRKDTLYQVFQNTRKARYQRPVHHYSINDIPATDDEYRSIVVDTEGVVTFRNPLTNDTTAIDSLIWKAYARSLTHGRELRALVESGEPILKRDSISYVPDIHDEPIPGSFKRLAMCLVHSMYAVLFEASSGKVSEKGFYPYQVERLQSDEYYRE